MSRPDKLTAYRIAYLARRWGVTPEMAAMLAALAFGGDER
jgi:hypothetical protein